MGTRRVNERRTAGLAIAGTKVAEGLCGRLNDPTFTQESGRNRDNPCDHPRLGNFRRKPGALRRQMACIGPGSLLSVHGSGVGYPVETID